jgi:mannose-1-phosphate guanylyltransferase/phosphomannomutase
MLRTTPGDPQSIDIVFLDADGADLSAAAQRKLERVHSRQEFRRAFPGEIAELSFPSRALDTYIEQMLASIDVSAVREAALKVVIDTTGGAATLILPSLLGRLGVDALTVNGSLNEAQPTESLAARMRDLERLGDLVSASGAAFGVKFDHGGERLAIVDDAGSVVDDGRSLLVLLDLVAAERRSGSIALPVTTTRIAEEVTRFHGTDIKWVAQSPDELSRAAREPDVIFAGDGRGGFIVPEFSASFDAIAAFVRLVGLVARTKLTLSQIDARIPKASVLRRSVPTPWAAKGLVMRQVVEQAGDRTLDTTDGVRVVEPDGSWVLVLPDPAEPVTHLWAESGATTDAADVLERWAGVVEAAGR